MHEDFYSVVYGWVNRTFSFENIYALAGTHGAILISNLRERLHYNNKDAEKYTEERDN